MDPPRPASPRCPLSVITARKGCVFAESDVLAYLAGRPADRFACCVTSPPYLGKMRRYGGKGTEFTKDQWVDWMRQVVLGACRVTRGYVFVVANNPVKGGEYLTANEHLMNLVSDRHSAAVRLHRPLVWWKNASSAPKNYFRNDYEQVLVFSNAAHKLPHFDWRAIATPKKHATGGRYRLRSNTTGGRKAGGAYPAGPLARPSDVLRFTVGGGHMGFDREDDKLACSGFAPFPLKLAEHLVRCASAPGDVVLDPFMGSGTTAVAAVRLGRTAEGCDSDPAAIKVALARLGRL